MLTCNLRIAEENHTDRITVLWPCVKHQNGKIKFSYAFKMNENAVQLWKHATLFISTCDKYMYLNMDIIHLFIWDGFVDMWLFLHLHTHCQLKYKWYYHAFWHYI